MFRPELALALCGLTLSAFSAGGSVFPELNAETQLDAGGPFAINGDTLLAGGHIFVRSPNGWTEQKRFSAGQGAIDGNTIIFDGRAVYVRAGTNWGLQKVLPLTGMAAISSDTIPVGIWYETPVTGYHGAVHVFVRSGTQWSEQATLSATPAIYGMGFGYSVAIDGDRLVAGAPDVRADFGTVPAAYVFVRSGTNWSQQAILTDPEGTTYPDSIFGTAVGISGNTIVVGDSGAVSIFVWNGTAWQFQQKIKGTNNFGRLLSITGDTFVASDPFQAGNVHLFARTGTNWTELPTPADNGGYQIGPSTAVGTNALVVGTSFGSLVYEPRSWTWQDQDIGAASPAGALNLSNITVTVTGSGADIAGAALGAGISSSGANRTFFCFIWRFCRIFWPSVVNVSRYCGFS